MIFSLLINMKMPTIGIFIFITRENLMLSWVEHEKKKFYNRRAGYSWTSLILFYNLYICRQISCTVIPKGITEYGTIEKGTFTKEVVSDKHYFIHGWINIVASVSKANRILDQLAWRSSNEHLYTNNYQTHLQAVVNNLFRAIAITLNP